MRRSVSGTTSNASLSRSPDDREAAARDVDGVADRGRAAPARGARSPAAAPLVALDRRDRAHLFDDAGEHAGPRPGADYGRARSCPPPAGPDPPARRRSRSPARRRAPPRPAPSIARPSPPSIIGATNSAIESTTPARSSPAASSAPPSTSSDVTPRSPSARSASAGLSASRRSTPAGRRRRARRRDPQRPRRARKLESPAQPSAAVEHDAQRLALGRRLQVARVEPGIVRERRAAAHGHCVHRGPPDVHELAALGRRDPAALARRRCRAPVERRGELEQHEGSPVDGVRAKRSVLTPRAPLQVAGRDLDLDARRAQALEALPADLRRRIARRADDPRDARPRSARRHTAVDGRGARRARATRTRSRRRRLACRRSSAFVSAWRSPGRTCHPSPSTSPSRTITQPTTGFGLAVNRPRSASSSVRSRSARRRPSCEAGGRDDRAVGVSW